MYAMPGCRAVEFRNTFQFPEHKGNTLLTFQKRRSQNKSCQATTTISRQSPTKHGTRRSLLSSVHIDAGFVEIGFVQLSQEVIPPRIADIQQTGRHIKYWKPGGNLFFPQVKTTSSNLRTLFFLQAKGTLLPERDDAACYMP